MKILIDNGHGLMTAGKRSPDGLFREAFYNREIARKVVADLLDKNLDAELLGIRCKTLCLSIDVL